ncbi:SRPBCC domain-containing protein [Chitiniphilus purpureus]|uniref:SRPBCC domain-containing protein n=1 Tax=Chitiniphilus purpureus TaxID=2981137 RepID=A0ABY6DKY9_9NEIS|nr:SRPBCC domain-containing protein [Chitiniphilus sp. CD1]UXY14702.1 SRPBCC domain-containing protein [Chitiniphilus sp. CD1]
MTTAPLIVTRSLVSGAPRAALWSVLTEPRHLRQWMQVVPAFPDERPLQAGSLVEWRDVAGQPYLLGRVTRFEPQHRWVMTLHDRSWPRQPEADEVTYGFALSEMADGVRIDFRLGDLAIDPQGQGWHDSYAHSQELERIARLAQALASGPTAQE